MNIAALLSMLLYMAIVDVNQQLIYTITTDKKEIETMMTHRASHAGISLCRTSATHA
jgi:hypothetical protein